MIEQGLQGRALSQQSAVMHLCQQYLAGVLDGVCPLVAAQHGPPRTTLLHSFIKRLTVRALTCQLAVAAMRCTAWLLQLPGAACIQQDQMLELSASQHCARIRERGKGIYPVCVCVCVCVCVVFAHPADSMHDVQGILAKNFPNTMPPIHCFNMLFLVSLVWGLGGSLVQESRAKYEAFLRTYFENDRDFELPEGSLFDYGLVKQLHLLVLSSWADIAATQPAPAFGVRCSAGYVSVAFLVQVHTILSGCLPDCLLACLQLTPKSCSCT